MILRFLPMYMRKYERMKMINDINNKSGRNSKDNAVFVFSGVTSYAMESSMETADIMESNGLHNRHRYSAAATGSGSGTVFCL